MHMYDSWVTVLDVQFSDGCPNLLVPHSCRREGGAESVCGPGSADEGGHEEGEEADPGPAPQTQETGGEGNKDKDKTTKTKATHNH